jgi:hypothetical protein
VQKTGYFRQLLRLFAAESLSYLIVPLMIFAASRSNATESIPKPAMIRQDSPTQQSRTADRNHFATDIFNHKSPTEIISRPAITSITNFWPNVDLVKQSGTYQGGEIRLIHKKLGTTVCSERWMDIQAGYGRVCYDPADLKKIIPDWNEPGCLYVKATLSF